MGKLSYGLKNKVVVVTGASRGIGLEIARLLLEQNARVVICGRKPEGLDAAVAELGGGDNLLAVSAHTAKEDQVNALFEQTLATFGTVDALINNVGMNIVTGTVDADFGVWKKIVDSNLNGAFLCSRKAGQVMREKQKGKIVSITSIAAQKAAPFMGVYGVAKAGIEMMTRVIAQELAPFNIQANAVAPCMVRTKFSEPFWSNPDIYAQVVKTIPLGRIAEPADVAHPVLFLCSAAADFITGQTVNVDGGATAVSI
ncbi:MAG: SDR family oxidoreductase [Desulfobacterales bacterium]|nr:SDR family oxidoreductase [Desulfobacterales bacterium]